MKKLIFILCLLPGTLFAQFGVSGYLDQSFSRFDTRGLNNFFKSYNEFWGSEISEPFDTVRAGAFSHPNWGLGVRFVDEGKVGLTAGSGFLIGRGTRNRYMTWRNGVQQRLKMRVSDVQWTLSAGAHIKNFIFLEGYMGAHIRNLKFTYSTIYQDGSESISTEYKINGYYSGLVSTLEWGFQAGVRIKPVMVYARFTWPTGWPPAKGLIDLTDYDTPDFPSTSFPTDYALWATDPLAFTEQDAGLKTDDFEGARISIGLEFILGANPK